MGIDLEKLEITHNAVESRFEARIEGRLCKLDYMRNGNTLVITHVGVQPEFRGQGVAAKLMQASLEYVTQNSMRVIPMCSYAAAYIHKNPQYADLMNKRVDE